MKNTSRILQLATQIIENTTMVNDYLMATGHPQPSFDIDGPIDLALESTEAEKARMNCIGASMELQDLMQGPIACLRPAVNTSQKKTYTKEFFHELTKTHNQKRSTPLASKPYTVMTSPAKSPSTAAGSPSKTSLTNAICTSRISDVSSATPFSTTVCFRNHEQASSRTRPHHGSW